MEEPRSENFDEKMHEFAFMLRHAADCVEWYRRRTKMHDCNDCAKGCGYEPKWGEMVRVNCPLWREKDE